MGMNGNFARLTPDQARALRDRVRPMLNYMRRFMARLDQRGFNPKGTLYQTAFSAYKALHRLHMDLHYRSCGDVVGRSLDEE
jgi:hypothetical protein